LGLDGAHSNRINGNNVSSNQRYGIEVFQSGLNRFSGNLVSDNGFTGYWVLRSTGNVISSSDASRNKISAGVELNLSKGNTVRDVIAHNNGRFGIAIGANREEARGNVFQSNSATGNGWHDMHDNNALPCVNTWIDNAFVSSGGNGAACIE
jgi:parallel beta-helix repeat protein